MLFDPLEQQLSQRYQESQRGVAYDYPEPTFYQMALWGNAQPFAATIAFHEISKHIDFAAMKNFFRHLFLSDPDPTEVRSHYEDRLGLRVPVSDEEFGEMMAEVRKFKWLEAEKAGRDIWRERHPEDPEAGALRIWFEKHFGAWYLARQNRFSTH